jgi:hypothetical protein
VRLADDELYDDRDEPPPRWLPISVTAVTGAAIANSQINNIQGLANSIPNVQINSFSNSPDSAVFTIRGIGVNDPLRLAWEVSPHTARALGNLRPCCRHVNGVAKDRLGSMASAARSAACT